MPASSFSEKIFQPAVREGTSRFVFIAFWLVVFVGALISGAPWLNQTSLLFASVGVLMLIAPPVVKPPRIGLALALLFVFLAASPFLPSAWFPAPSWRTTLESLGVETGPHVVIQWKPALEMYGIFLLIVLTGIWLACHRPSSMQLRNTALAFTVGVAVYASLAEIFRERLAIYPSQFGFFPNRNHTGTYLAMGTISGLGVALQALRDRHFWRMALSLLSFAICVWAAFNWSISRGGIILIAIGGVLWIPLLGRRYLGRHGSKAVVLVALLMVGGYLLNQTLVKERLSDTADKIAVASEVAPEDGVGSFTLDQMIGVDFRVPIALDTWDMIQDAPWTGVGAGQFVHVFPQYRTRTAVLNHATALHPESDWLWMAAETGVPAALSLAVLVAVAFIYAAKGLFSGRDRALRAACLVTAALVPIHGCFDVPGHRLPLAFASILMFALSLQTSHPPHLSRRSRVMGRAIALPALGFVLLLNLHRWSDASPPALVLGEINFEKGAALYQAAAFPPSVEEGIENASAAIDLARETHRVLPLNRRIIHFQARANSLFQGNKDETLRLFTIERHLHPTSVGIPLTQASAVLPVFPEESLILWKEALLRADWMEAHHPKSRFSRSPTFRRIQQEVAPYPRLKTQIAPLLNTDHN